MGLVAATPRFPRAETWLAEPRSGRWLSILWPAAICWHLAANGSHLAVLDTVGILQVMMAVVAATMIWRPTGAGAIGLALTFLVVFWLKLPVVGNHEVILALFGLIVIPAVLATGPRWTEVVMPAGRVLLLVAYGFIALSKLNSDFFDTAVSCAVLFGDGLGSVVGLRPSRSPSLATTVIVATAAIELVIPVLLAIRRFRSTGVLVALIFHFVLALDPTSHVWDFSATLLPLFLMFGSSDVSDELDRRLAWLRRPSAGARMLLFGLILCLQWLLLVGVRLPTAVPFVGDRTIAAWLIAYPLWLAVGGITIAVAARARFGRIAPAPSPGDEGASPTIGRPIKLVWGLVMALTVLNGVAPYLEVRSAAAFNMYSNLRVVDGRSNHFLFGSVRDDGRDSFVEVLDAVEVGELAYYVDNELLLPAENLDRYLSDIEDGDPVIKTGVGPMSARAAGYGTADGGSGRWQRLQAVLQRKLGFRRAVNHADDGSCLRSWGPLG